MEIFGHDIGSFEARQGILLATSAGCWDGPESWTSRSDMSPGQHDGRHRALAAGQQRTAS